MSNEHGAQRLCCQPFIRHSDPITAASIDRILTPHHAPYPRPNRTRVPSACPPPDHERLPLALLPHRSGGVQRSPIQLRMDWALGGGALAGPKTDRDQPSFSLWTPSIAARSFLILTSHIHCVQRKRVLLPHTSARPAALTAPVAAGTSGGSSRGGPPSCAILILLLFGSRLPQHVHVVCCILRVVDVVVVAVVVVGSCRGGRSSCCHLRSTDRTRDT